MLKWSFPNAHGVVTARTQLLEIQAQPMADDTYSAWVRLHDEDAEGLAETHDHATLDDAKAAAVALARTALDELYAAECAALGGKA